MKKLLRYFLQGLLLIAPLSITITIIVISLQNIGKLFNIVGLKLHPYADPLLGLVCILVLVTIIGFLSSTFLLKPIFFSIEQVLVRTPLIKIIYTSIKDLFSAFVSDKRKFNKPVLVDINRSTGLQKLGFITQQDLSHLGIQDKIAVYLPHSYNFSGNLFIVPTENVTILEGVSSTEVMKFIVSGGITEIETIESTNNN